MFQVQILTLSEYSNGPDMWDVTHTSHKFTDEDEAIEWGLVQTGCYCDDDDWSHKHLNFKVIEVS